MSDSSHEQERWARITALFHQAIDRPPAERRAWLERVQLDEPGLAREVASLLEAHDRADGFLDPPGRRSIGPYEIHGVIGRGGMGVVYLATDTRLGRTVALKALTPERVGIATYRERLRREARAAASLRHPGIATVFALEELDGELYMASEYVPGETLRDELARGALPVDRALETALAIARALAAAHAAGIVHRDLKPDNVVRDTEGRIRILDFGVARLPREMAPRITQDGSVFGTPAYMSPEQIRGREADARSDLFSFGVMLYELLTGTTPFGHDEPPVTLARILEIAPPPPSSVRPDVLAVVDDLVLACLEKDPANRPASAEAVAKWIEQIRAPVGLAGPRPTPSARLTPGLLTPPGSVTSAPIDGRARWWWRFHQAAVTAGYAVLLVPLWQVRGLVWTGGGRLIFLTGLIAAIVSCTLRLHLWFADDLDPLERARQQQRSASWIRAADVIFVAVLATAGLLTLDVTDVAGVVLVAGAAAAVVSFTMIEPSTTRAAFGEDRSARDAGAP